MKYRNTKTGVIIDTYSKINGDWELVTETDTPKEQKSEDKPSENKSDSSSTKKKTTTRKTTTKKASK